MKTKYCNKCDTYKSVDDFHKNPKKKDGIQTMCKECRKVYHKKHYEKNKGRYTNQNVAIRKRNKDFINRYKRTQKCSRCPETRWYVLDFHHLDKKDVEVSVMVNKCFSLKKIKEEIRKCEIVCANCHREIHYFQKLYE